MPAGLKVERVVARVEVGELVEKMQGMLRVELGVCARSCDETAFYGEL